MQFDVDDGRVDGTVVKDETRPQLTRRSGAAS